MCSLETTYYVNVRDTGSFYNDSFIELCYTGKQGNNGKNYKNNIVFCVIHSWPSTDDNLLMLIAVFTDLPIPLDCDHQIFFLTS